MRILLMPYENIYFQKNISVPYIRPLQVHFRLTNSRICSGYVRSVWIQIAERTHSKIHFLSLYHEKIIWTIRDNTEHVLRLSDYRSVLHTEEVPDPHLLSNTVCPVFVVSSHFIQSNVWILFYTRLRSLLFILPSLNHHLMHTFHTPSHAAWPILRRI